MIRAFDPTDHPMVSALITGAYGRDYESGLITSLRNAGDLAAEFVWSEQGQILGHVSLGRHLHPEGWYMISTVAVQPVARGCGIGSDLVRAALDAARQADAGAVTVLGHARYYQRFGFTRTAAEALETPFSRDNTLMYPIRIENAGLMAELVYPTAYSCL